MDNGDDPDTKQGQDESEVDIIPLDQPASVVKARRTQWQRLKVAPRRGRLMWRVSVGLAIVLLLLLVLQENLASVKSITLGVWNSWMPSPTPTLAPADEDFYFYVNLPGTSVHIDGRQVKLPRVGVDAPIRLSRGRHMIMWRDAPFQDQYCQISVPTAKGDNCNLATDQLAPQEMAQLLALPMSFAALNLSQQSELAAAVQAAINSVHASQLVQAGELHLGPQAMQPLEAALHFQFSVQDAASQAYTLAGEDCQQLCVIPWQALLSQNIEPTAPGEWLALIFVSASWSYATLDGRVMAQNEPIDSGGAAVTTQPMLLRMAWDGTSWNVKALIGPDQAPLITVYGGVPLLQHPVYPLNGVQIPDDPACAAARDLLSQDALVMAQKRFISGPNPAAGCLVEATSNATSTAGMPAAAPALYLEHLGVLLAVNSFAHKLEPYLPVADAYEQGLARQLQGYAGQVISTP